MQTDWTLIDQQIAVLSDGKKHILIAVMLPVCRIQSIGSVGI